jgi:hypothetical protein
LHHGDVSAHLGEEGALVVAQEGKARHLEGFGLVRVRVRVRVRVGVRVRVRVGVGCWGEG